MPITKGKISYTLNLKDEFDKNGIKDTDKKDTLLKAAGSLILSEVVQYLDKGVTPVSKGSYKKSISPEYKKVKTKKGGKPLADMQLTDNMLNSIEFRNSGNKLTIGIVGTDKDTKTSKLKAYNHNVGDTLPKRQWLPDDSKDEKFKRSIIKKVKDLIKSEAEN